MTDRTRTLVRLSDSQQTIADPAEDVRGRTVRDHDGEEVGKVEDLLIDPHAREVRFLRVEHGGILGFGATPSFVPVDAVARITDDEVHLARAGQDIAGAPAYDPDLVDQRPYFESLYGYYGYMPYWSPGYMYPGFPTPAAFEPPPVEPEGRPDDQRP
jgi:sporulation protein YlmC with PRC-barrel domain